MSVSALSDPIAREDRLFALRDDGPPTRRTLYLPARAERPVLLSASKDILSVEVRNGDAKHFPFKRIGRIVASSHVAWRGSALARTLEHGISITWTDGNGRYLGNAEPPQANAFGGNTRIELYLETARWRCHFDNWHIRRRLQVLNASTMRARNWGFDADPFLFAERKRSFVHRGEVEATLPPLAHAWCRSWVADFLFRQGLHRRYIGLNDVELDLGAELGVLVWAELNFDSGSLAKAPRQDERMRIQWFDNWTRRRAHSLEGHLIDFRRHVSTVLASPWL